MNEHLDSAQLVGQIKHLIKSKDWYSLTESSRFVWEKSVKVMAEMISKEIGPIEPGEIQRIIENSFTPDALSMVGQEYFVDLLLEIDPELILWSEGDLSWQAIKASRTGLTDRQGIRVELFAKNKGNKLKDIILSLVDEFDEEVCVVVIDDKENNLTHALSLRDQFSDMGVTIRTYHLNLRNAQANLEACMSFLSEMREKNIRLIVDMDGVLVNTDRVLSDLVSQKLALLLTKKTTSSPQRD
jgi:hypothetical protein